VWADKPAHRHHSASDSEPSEGRPAGPLIYFNVILLSMSTGFFPLQLANKIIHALVQGHRILCGVGTHKHDYVTLATG
jgi:hypothetical protein